MFAYNFRDEKRYLKKFHAVYCTVLVYKTEVTSEALKHQLLYMLRTNLLHAYLYDVTKMQLVFSFVILFAMLLRKEESPGKINCF